jgi:hypothetical protein
MISDKPTITQEPIVNYKGGKDMGVINASFVGTIRNGKGNGYGSGGDDDFSLNYEVNGNRFVFLYISQTIETASDTMGLAMKMGCGCISISFINPVVDWFFMWFFDTKVCILIFLFYFERPVYLVHVVFPLVSLFSHTVGFRGYAQLHDGLQELACRGEPVGRDSHRQGSVQPLYHELLRVQFSQLLDPEYQEHPDSEL